MLLLSLLLLHKIEKISIQLSQCIPSVPAFFPPRADLCLCICLPQNLPHVFSKGESALCLQLQERLLSTSHCPQIRTSASIRSFHRLENRKDDDSGINLAQGIRLDSNDYQKQFKALHPERSQNQFPWQWVITLIYGVRETLLRSDDWQQHLYPHNAEWGDRESDNFKENKWFGFFVGEKMNTARCKAKNTA